MKKEQIQKKLTFKKKLVANLNPNAAEKVLGGFGAAGQPNSGTDTCDDKKQSVSTGCFTCECGGND